MQPGFILSAVAGVAALSLAACGDTSSDTATGSSGKFPLTVENCDAEVTFDEAPDNVVLLKSASVPFLHELGVLDRVSARAGQYPSAYYDDETNAELDDIESMTDKLDASGHLQISKEVVIAQEPDLVLGEVDNLSRATLDPVGINLLEEPALCEDGVEDPGFDDVYDQLEMYGTVFDREDEAAAAIKKWQQREQEATAATPTGRTAAILYPTVGGGTTYAYGTKSMAHPQLEAAGFENAFGDVDKRVFEVTLEELLGRNPDVLIMIYSEGDPQAVEDAVTGLPGAQNLTAVQNDQLMTQLFNFTEPPSPLSIVGLEQITARFGTTP